MKLSYYILISYLIVSKTNGKILTCNESVESNVYFDVEKIRDYVSSKNPKPLPTEINSSFMVRDITDVDENQQTVPSIINESGLWQDCRLDVKRSKDDQEKYVNHQLS